MNKKIKITETEKVTAILLILQTELRSSPKGREALTELLTWFQDNLTNLKTNIGTIDLTGQELELAENIVGNPENTEYIPDIDSTGYDHDEAMYQEGLEAQQAESQMITHYQER